MGISVKQLLDYSYNHGYIVVMNNKGLNDVLWQGKSDIIDYKNYYKIKDLEVVKWGIENNGIVIYVDYEKDNK